MIEDAFDRGAAGMPSRSSTQSHSINTDWKTRIDAQGCLGSAPIRLDQKPNGDCAARENRERRRLVGWAGSIIWFSAAEGPAVLSDSHARTRCTQRAAAERTRNGCTQGKRNLFSF